MFSEATSLSHQGTQGREHLWTVGGDPTSGCLAATLLSNEVVRVRFLRNVPEPIAYQLTDGGPGTLPYHSWTVAKGDETWPVDENQMDVRSLLEPYLQGFALSATTLQLRRPLTTNEQIYGFGERTGSMNKRGQAFPVWNVDFPGQHDESVTSMYTSIPFYLSLQPESGHTSGVFLDHTDQIDVDMGKTDVHQATLSVESDSLVAYFFAGPTPADVLRQYTELTGRMPLPARWALGHHQCRWSYMSQDRVAEIATKLRERHHPCDAIWLDIDYMDGYKNFTFDPERFATPELMSQQLHEQGFHVVTILDPGTKVDDSYDIYQQGKEKDYFCRYGSGELFVGSVWPGASAFPDFSRTEVRQWWGNLYQRLLDKGVDGIWNDMDEPALTNSLLNDAAITEPSLWGKTMDPNVLHQAGGNNPTGPDGPLVNHRLFHNAYGMEMARSTYEGLLRLRPNSRPFVLTRSGTAGMQRYTALWTGDNSSQWSHIGLAIRMCLSVGISGQAFVGSDIGGFWDTCNGELLARFAQLGSLMPFSRNHNAAGNPDQEPWVFGEPYESAYRKAIETRYRLLPYLYTLFHQATLDGSPVMRPLFYHYPQDQKACEIQTEFLLGEILLSAPIMEQGAESREVYLPDGTWFDFWDGTKYAGEATYQIAAPLDRWPLFVRGNSILPLGPIMQYTDQHTSDPLTLLCHLEEGGEAEFTLYEDDGNTRTYSKGAFASTHIRCRATTTGITVQIQEQHAGYPDQREFYDVIVRNGDRILDQQVRAGQGTIVFQI